MEVRQAVSAVQAGKQSVRRRASPRDIAVVERSATGEQQRRLGNWVERRRAGQSDGGGPCER